MNRWRRVTENLSKDLDLINPLSLWLDGHWVHCDLMANVPKHYCIPQTICQSDEHHSNVFCLYICVAFGPVRYFLWKEKKWTTCKALQKVCSISCQSKGNLHVFMKCVLKKSVLVSIDKLAALYRSTPRVNAHGLISLFFPPSSFKITLIIYP